MAIRLLSHEVPVVGEEYDVPCVWDYRDNTWKPVAGEPHVDDDHFNGTPKHWHIDSRFSALPEVEFIGLHVDRVSKETSLQPMVCVRSTPQRWDHTDKMVLTLAALYAQYGDRPKPACGTCPHKGMPIHNGVCSGHRLEWLENGEPRYKPPIYAIIKGEKEDSRGVFDGSVRGRFPIEVRETLTLTPESEIIIMDSRGEQLGIYHPQWSICALNGDVLNISYTGSNR